MYEIVVGSSVYEQWDCYNKWWNSGITDPQNFNDWVILHYPEIVLVKWIDSSDDRRFTFASENHYHWFLLRQ